MLQRGFEKKNSGNEDLLIGNEFPANVLGIQRSVLGNQMKFPFFWFKCKFV